MNTVEESELNCPSCGERVTLFIDTSIEQQEYPEDCPVCCSPMLLYVICSERDGVVVSAEAENS